MKITKKLISIIIIILLISNMCVISNAGNTGYFRLYISILDCNGQPIPGIKVTLTNVKHSSGQSLIGNYEITTETSNESIKHIRDIKYYDCTGLVCGDIKLENLPSGYGEQEEHVGFEFTVLDKNSGVSSNVSMDTKDWSLPEFTRSNVIESGEWENLANSTTGKVLKLKLKQLNTNTNQQTTTTSTFNGCAVTTENIEGIGPVLEIVSNNESIDTSISIADSVKYLQQQGKIVTSITDPNSGNVDLTSTDLIGTGYTITAGSESIKTVVYGDMTGDGLINAADINIVINSFLGNITDLSNVITLAGDIQQNNSLDAGDISLMIHSFLGTLEGDILKTE